MRFAARLTEPLAMSTVLSALKQLGTNALLNMTPTRWTFNLTAEFSSGEMAFVDLPIKHLFESYRIQSNADNNIPLIVDLRNLIHALQSARYSQETTVRLNSKSNRVCLSFTICQESGRASIVQDVPISLQRLSRVMECAEPTADPGIKIRIPDLKSLKGVVDKMRSLSDRLCVCITSCGDLKLSVKTDMVSVSTHYKNLLLRSRNSVNSKIEGRSHEDSQTCLIDARKFSKILSAHILEPRLMIGGIIHDDWFVIHLQIDERASTMTLYVPLLPDI